MDQLRASVVLDLVTDTSSSTISQLISATEDKITVLQRGIQQQQQEGELHKQNGHDHLLPPCDKDKPHCALVALSKLPLDNLPIQPSKVIVSENCLELFFRAKTHLDQRPGFGGHIHLITSLAMKKFWEAVCLHLLAPIHTWSVCGVPVLDQPASAREPTPVGQVESKVKDFLTTVGDPGQVSIRRCSVIPARQFNAGYHDRHGGASQWHPLASMNVIYTTRKPDPELVIQENRRRLARAAGFDPAAMYVTKAEHDQTIWVVGQDQPARYDGIATDQPGVTVCAAGADCCMILLADTRTGAVGAVHAGWRGTAIGAVISLLHTMAREFGSAPADIRATIGPSICGDHFDLPAEDARPITDLDPTLTWPSTVNQGYVHADLVRANATMLEREGVPAEAIDTMHALCTVEHLQFFSHRRDGLFFGNQVGFISCRPQGNDC